MCDLSHLPPITTEICELRDGALALTDFTTHCRFAKVGLDWYNMDAPTMSRTHLVRLLEAELAPHVDASILLAKSPRAQCLTLVGAAGRIRAQRDVKWIGAHSYVTIATRLTVDEGAHIEPNAVPSGDAPRILEVRASGLDAAARLLAPTHLVMRGVDVITHVPPTVAHVYVDVNAPPQIKQEWVCAPLESLAIGERAICVGWMKVKVPAKNFTLFLPARFPFGAHAAFARMVRDNPDSTFRVHAEHGSSDPRTIPLLIRTFVALRGAKSTLEVSGNIDYALVHDLTLFVVYETERVRSQSTPPFAYVDSTGVCWNDAKLVDDTALVTTENGRTLFKNMNVSVTECDAPTIAWLSGART